MSTNTPPKIHVLDWELGDCHCGCRGSITAAHYDDGTELTEVELDELNDSGFGGEYVMEHRI